MPPPPLDYSRAPEPRRLPLIRLTVALLLLLASIACCLATWRTPTRLLLPAGDATTGLRSHAGWIERTEHTPWDDRDYLSWSIPWSLPITLEIAFILITLHRHRRATGDRRT